MPIIGCFTVGYILLICKEHYESLANLDRKLYEEMLNLKDKIEREVAEKLGTSCLASCLGVEEWDWKENYYLNNFFKTLELFMKTNIILTDKSGKQ